MCTKIPLAWRKRKFIIVHFFKYKVSENFTFNADCYINDGKFYRGFANTTEKGFNCQNWKSTGRMNLTSDSEKVTIYSSSGSKLIL